MAKIQYPPQGGEKKICLSLCAMSLCSVISGVLMVYFTAIIYLPGANVLHSKIEGIANNNFYPIDYIRLDKTRIIKSY